MSYINQCCRVLSDSLDGKNLESVLLELGMQMHKVVFEHVQTHIVNEMGECMSTYVCTCVCVGGGGGGGGSGCNSQSMHAGIFACT